MELASFLFRVFHLGGKEISIARSALWYPSEMKPYDTFRSIFASLDFGMCLCDYILLLMREELMRPFIVFRALAILVVSRARANVPGLRCAP